MKKNHNTETKAVTKETPDSDMLVEERRRRIRELVGERGRITVAELVAMFDISQVTVRSDLNALAEIGAVVRTRGGALAQRADEDLPIGVKQTLRRAEKVRIAEAAVRLIGEGQTIVLDSGTTTAEIAKQIRGLKLQSVNVITNALNIAVLLAGAPHVTLIMLGGVLRPSSYSLGGPQAEAALQGLHADILFLGFDGLDPEIGVMTPHLLEARLNSRMLEIARSVVAVGDSSKLGRRSLSVIARIEQVDRIITDAGAAPETVEALRARGAQVTLV
ncbi:DeoR family transcriptional regulator of aga operon [Duganella sp. 1411]|uniref:DeoR/GlpR family DNA-binding transcription regulator n=1 Tax=Duganella sp. 1411 TaxID=2806572 RepID=UPI001AE81083|nr:DeoR/GlpR family DNA-binding transcription regulator [Duganella sp. 1411]MBP1202900.1 DeoR family transcriptional regulator of aga operon [Duganella sp. 1411]